MKNKKKLITAGFAACFMLFASIFIAPTAALAATTPSLGMAATYGVLSGTYTNTAAGTTINGDVGFTTGPAVAPAGVHTNYGSGAPYSTAGTDQASALSALNSQSCTFTFAPGAINLSTDTTHGTAGLYTPGVYCSTGAMDIGGPLTLSGSGTYIFRPVGAFTSTAGAIVTLTGSSACDVFWTPTAATTLAANTTFAGSVIQPTSSAITVGANTTWTGRALAFGGTVTTDTDTITVPNCAPAPATLHIIKTVINNNGGVATASSATIHVKSGLADVAGSPQAGAVSPGTAYSLAAGTYVVSENPLVGYNAAFSGDCDSSGSITLLAGVDKTCTITNDDIAPGPGSINVVKTVVNDNGGKNVVADFPLFVNGTLVISGITNSFAAPATYTVTETSNSRYAQSFSGDCDSTGHISLNPGDNKFCIITNDDIPLPSTGGAIASPSPMVPPIIDVVKVPSPLALPSGPGLVKYTYTLRNIGTVPVTDITMVGDSCSPITLISGDINNDAVLNLNETWIYTCTTRLTETHTNNVVATGWANGLEATDVASATVVVGLPVVPPLIHVTKVPDPLALSARGGIVTYTETITNPGTVPLHNVLLTDDKCAPLNFISGDANANAMLDPAEAWRYTCQTNLTKTTTNTAIASGTANGLTVRDIAIVTVLVAAPGLPNAGFSPAVKDASFYVLILSGILMLVSIAFLRFIKKHNLF